MVAKSAFMVILYIAIASAQYAKNLTDDNFEHDTQATTGSTTGDWFLLFCGSDKTLACGQNVRDKWNELYGILRGRATVAFIELEHARETQERLKVMYNEVPVILFISKGKWYRFRFERDPQDFITPILDLDALESFVVDR